MYTVSNYPEGLLINFTFANSRRFWKWSQTTTVKY